MPEMNVILSKTDQNILSKTRNKNITRIDNDKMISIY